jgi:hypothetical protein
MLPLVGLACAAARPTVPAEAIERLEELPGAYSALGDVRASCTEREGWDSAYGEPLSSFDCTETRLRRVLAELASERGGDVLAEERCEHLGSDRRELACGARVGRRPDAELRAKPLAPVSTGDGLSSPAPAAAEVRRADEPRARLAFEIRVDFEPRVARFAGARKPAEGVKWLTSLPLSHVELGVLRTFCDADECALADLRHALRVAAGGLGASDVIGARCATLDSESFCVAEVAAAEIDAAVR